MSGARTHKVTVRMDDELLAAAQRRSDARGHESLTAALLLLTRGFIDGTYDPEPAPIGRPEHPQKPEALRLLADGVGAHATARRLGVSYPTARRWATAAGLPIAPQEQ